MKLVCLLGAALLLASGCGDIDEVQVQTQSVKTNTRTAYLSIDNTIVAEVDQIIVDGQDVLLEPDHNKLKQLKHKTAIVVLKPPGLACGKLVQAVLGVGNPTLVPSGFDKPVHAPDSLSIYAPPSEDNEATRFNLFESFPTRWDSGDFSPASNVACETIKAKMGEVELG